MTTSGSDTFERRVRGQSTFAKEALNELKLIGFRNILPYETWMSDKPWNLVWVRWFIGVALFPLALTYWVATQHPAFDSVAFLFGVYFALMWGVVLYFMLQPKLQVKRIIQVGLFTMSIGMAIDLLLQQLPIVSSLYTETESASLVGRLIGFVLGVGIVEELTKALPVWWLYIHKNQEDTLSTKVFIGCVSGFAFGVAEAVDYSIRYLLGLALGGVNGGEYLVLQMTRLISLPLLHAIWAGIAAYFIALASVNKSVRKGLLIAGLLTVACLHGLYDAFGGTIVAVLIAVASMLMFTAYYRSSEALQAKLGTLGLRDTDQAEPVVVISPEATAEQATV